MIGITDKTERDITYKEVETTHNKHITESKKLFNQDRNSSSRLSINSSELTPSESKPDPDSVNQRKTSCQMRESFGNFL